MLSWSEWEGITGAIVFVQDVSAEFADRQRATPRCPTYWVQIALQAIDRSSGRLRALLDTP